MPEQPFVTGESRFTIARPIIGPPLITLPATPGRPPAASISAEIGVPMRVSRFLGSLQAFARDGHHALDQRFVLQHGLIDGNGRQALHHGPHVDRQRGRRRNLTARDGCDQLFLTPCGYITFRGTTSMPLYPAAIFVRCAIASGFVVLDADIGFPDAHGLHQNRDATTSSSPCSSIVRWSDVR